MGAASIAMIATILALSIATERKRNAQNVKELVNMFAQAVVEKVRYSMNVFSRVMRKPNHTRPLLSKQGKNFIMDLNKY
ncbi:MAG: hypothetical protein IJR13_08050 [Bacteroidales bacterium]|nr:hypothetical protein [Bacteroidales bacterium]